MTRPIVAPGARVVRRRAFALRLGGALAMPWVAVAQNRRPFRIGILGVSSPESAAATNAAFQKALRDLGHVEGGSISYEYRWAHGAMDRLPGFAAELAALPVDIIVASTNPAIVAAQRATSTIPIVMVLGTEPVRNGFVQSLKRPGGNITGLTNDVGQEMHGKMLEILKEILPRAPRVGVLAQQGIGFDRAALEAAASGLQLRTDLNEVRSVEEVEAAFKAMVERRVDAYYVIGGPVLSTQRRRLGELGLAHRLPGMHWARDYVDAGGLASYGTRLEDRYLLAATYIDRIIKGASPAELPVELPSRFYLVVNRRTARAIGLPIPPAVLSRADDVID